MPRGTRHELILPELGLPGLPLCVGNWLVELGARVHEGDRLLEVLAGSVSIDLPSPAPGVLVEQFVAEDDPLHVGQVLGVIEADE